MLEETYFKFKKNILPKMKKMQPNFQEPVAEYCEPDQVIDICSYNHYPVLDKSSQKQEQCNDNNDIYDTSELEHEFEYGIYEDVLKTEQLMAELKRIDEAENESKKQRDLQFGDFPLEQFSDAGKVANEGDPHLKAAADTELYNLEKRAIQIDIDKYEYDNSSENTDDTYYDNSSRRADDDDNSSPRADDDNASHRAEEYSNTLYVKQTAIPLHAIQNIELLPDRKTTIEVVADRTNELQYKELIEGQGIVWVWSNDSSKPLQPIVAMFHNDKTLITFENTTGQTQHISKGAKVAVLDMRSKDGGMTNFEWDIPTDDEGNLVLYAHTFASSLEPTKLANEDPILQAETKIKVSQTPNKPKKYYV